VTWPGGSMVLCMSSCAVYLVLKDLLLSGERENTIRADNESTGGDFEGWMKVIGDMMKKYEKNMEEGDKSF